MCLAHDSMGVFRSVPAHLILVGSLRHHGQLAGGLSPGLSRKASCTWLVVGSLLAGRPMQLGHISPAGQLGLVHTEPQM